MATMKDVAAMAGVSFTTVSHVVNRTRPVSDAVRKKVEDAIAQLHYVPSAVARSLKVRTTSIIGLLVPNSTNPYFAELSRGIEDCCERNGYCVILCNSDDNPQKQANYLRVLQEKRIDGLVLASAGGDGALAKGLANMRTPSTSRSTITVGVRMFASPLASAPSPPADARTRPSMRFSWSTRR